MAHIHSSEIEAGTNHGRRRDERSRSLAAPVAIASLVVFWLLAPVALAQPASSTRPNVVVILTDDQGWGDLSVNGNANLSTPRIDSLARDGALFERFYVCPVCSPTRAEFLTGRYHPRGNVWNVSLGGERLDLDETTIGDVFKKAGYATSAFGKWHNGTQYPYHPNGRGFDEFYGFCSGHWGDYFDPPLEHNGEPVIGHGFIIDDLTEHALQFLETHQDKPFLCYLPFNTPHTPMQVPDRFYDKFRNAELPRRYHGKEPEDLDMTRAALAMCENIDWNVGRVLDKLSELKLSETTIVVYFSDNGPNSWRWNGGMKGRKGSTDEGGVRSPLLVRWPGKIAPGTKVTPIAGAIDLLPTLTDLCQINAPSPRTSQINSIGGKTDVGKSLDGQSLAPLLLGQAVAWPDRLIFSHWGGNVSVRSQQFRLDASGKLYDMFADPGQSRDVTAEHPDLTRTLAQAVASWRSEVLSEMQRIVHPFPVGYRQFPRTQLPARDGVPAGKIRRSDKAPNCSFFTNWTSPEDQITWDVEVATTGKYQVAIWYACPLADVGSSIELSLGESRLAGKVTEAHDPPLRGDEHDRYPRNGESLVKDFKLMTLGEIDLQQGHSLLTLKAIDIPGKQVMEVRGLLITLMNE